MKPAPLNSDTQAGKLLLSTLALYGIPSVFCSGAIVYSSSGINAIVMDLDDDNPVSWDIDGDEIGDFLISGTMFPVGGGSASRMSITYAGSSGSGRFVRLSSDDSGAIRNLNPGFTVGNSLPFGYSFDNNSGHTLISASFKDAKGFAINTSGSEEIVPGYVGFSFNIDGDTHYGWAEWTFQLGAIGESELTISEWAYNDVAEASIQVGAVPEPAETATAVGLLALGAAGVHRWRKNRVAP